MLKTTSDCGGWNFEDFPETVLLCFVVNLLGHER
jgi:hypothetical protein